MLRRLLPQRSQTLLVNLLLCPVLLALWLGPGILTPLMKFYTQKTFLSSHRAVSRKMSMKGGGESYGR